MGVEKPELLKEWLTATLPKMCGADPVALGKYILALVKKDKKDLKTFLLEQLEVFLQHNTAKFVELLTETLLTKSYLTKELEPAKQHESTKEPIRDKITEVQSVVNISSQPSMDSLTTNIKMENPVATGSYKPPGLRVDTNQEYVPTACKRVPQENVSVPTSKRTKYCDTNTTSDNRRGRSGNFPNKNDYFIKSSRRCRDFDEKGYCLRGGFCKFDHGEDPILVEKSPEKIISTLKSVSLGSNIKFEKQERTNSPFPPLPTSPPEIPPPPPPADIPEPYNPESPGMNLPMSFVNQSKLPPQSMSMSSSNLYPENSQASNLYPERSHVSSFYPENSQTSNLYQEKFDLYREAKRGRIRELINVDSSHNICDPNPVADDRSCLKPLNNVIGNFCAATKGPASHIAPQADSKPRRFDFSRLGSIPRTTLEIRKIPKAQNTIQNLNQHFSRFGTITNIEVSYDNDPEAAIISFSSNSEATAAYRSTDAILQNRFIKVFWNSQAQKRKLNTNLKDVNFRGFTSFPKVERKVVLSGDSESIRGETQVKKVLDVSESPLLVKGNPRSAYDSNRILPSPKKAFTKVANKKGFNEREGDIAAHKMKLHQAKNLLLDNTIKHQKQILDQLLKTTKKNEKLFLKKTLDAVSKQVEDLTNDLKKENDELKTLLKAKPNEANSKIVAKELLDAELDLYKKQNTHSDEESTELLLRKVNMMKKQAKAYGLTDYRHLSKTTFPKKTVVSHRTSLSIDRRTKKILISGKTLADKENLKEHFEQFGKIETIEENSMGLVVAFCTRNEAEAAYFHGAKYENKNLTLSWCNDAQISADEVAESDEKEEKMIEEEAFEDEDDSDARPWRT